MKKQCLIGSFPQVPVMILEFSATIQVRQFQSSLSKDQTSRRSIFRLLFSAVIPMQLQAIRLIHQHRLLLHRITFTPTLFQTSNHSRITTSRTMPHKFLTSLLPPYLQQHQRPSIHSSLKIESQNPSSNLMNNFLFEIYLYIIFNFYLFKFYLLFIFFKKKYLTN